MIIPRPLKKVLGKIIPFSQEDKIPTFNLGSGTADSTTYLRGDGTWSTVTGTAANKMYTVGRNSTGSTLYKGTIVYISGSTGNRPNFVKAQANSEATSAGTFGVIEADIPNNSDGNCVTIGTLDDLDTRTVATHPFTDVTLADGDTIYLHPTIAGYVTNVKPSAPNHLVYVGKVVRTSPTLGTIVYRIQNGYEIDELHDVAITSPTNGQILQYESATSLWKNVTISTSSINIGNSDLTSTDSSRVFNLNGNLNSNNFIIKNQAGSNCMIVRGNGDHEFSSNASASMSIRANTGYSYPGIYLYGQGGTEKAAMRMTSNRITFLNTTSNTVSMTITTTGVGIGIGDTGASAKLHISAGTSSVAPIRLTAGTNLTTPVNGTLEYDGTNLYFTTGGVRKTVTLV